MISPWHDFYVLLGTASAALVALLFVAASIGAGYISAQRSTATRTFMSPIIYHYTSVLFVSLMGLVPDVSDRQLSVVVGLVAALGLGFSLVVMVGVMRSTSTDIADRFGYGGGPLAAYAAALFAGWLLWTHAAAAPYVLAGALVLLLVINIRNAWDLTITFARRRTDGPPQ